MSLPENPISRNEHYLNRIATGEGEIPEYPISRIEKYLAYIAEHGGGGGGGAQVQLIQAESHDTKEGYVVPVLTDEQITKAYNGIVAGNNVFIVDDMETLTIPVLDASSIEEAVSVTAIFRDKLILTYQVGEEVIATLISSASIAWGGIADKPFETVGTGLSVDDDGVLSATNDYKTFVFKGYVSSAQPANAQDGDLWYQSAVMPTSFPVQVKTYNGSAWSIETTSYTPSALDMWADLDNEHGYYWFGNDWNIIDVNVAVDNVTIGLNSQGQIEIKLPYRLPAVTASDNGKFLRVSNGSWSKEEVDTKAMTVTYDDDTTETFNIFVESAT